MAISRYAQPVARGLAPVGLRSAPKNGRCIFPIRQHRIIYDCFAAERGQAPSPQGLVATLRVCLANPQPNFFKSRFNLPSTRVTLRHICFLRFSLWTVGQSHSTTRHPAVLVRPASVVGSCLPPRQTSQHFRPNWPSGRCLALVVNPGAGKSTSLDRPTI